MCNDATALTMLRALQFDTDSGAIIGDAKGSVVYKSDLKLLCFETASFSRYGGISRAKDSPEAEFNNVEEGASTSMPIATIVGSILGALALLTLLAWCLWVQQLRQRKADEKYVIPCSPLLHVLFVQDNTSDACLAFSKETTLSYN